MREIHPVSGLGLKVQPSGICLGTALLGSAIGRSDSFALLDAFAEMGGNFLDSANVYAAWLPNGEGASERTIGEWIAAHGARDAVIIGTKGGHPPMASAPQRGDCARETLDRHLDESLRRLGTDHIDLYWLHRDDPTRDVAEIVETLAAFHREGRISCFGASNWATPRIQEANTYAAEHDLPGFVATQPGWSLADPLPDSFATSGLLFLDGRAWEWNAASGMSVVPYSSQARGFFGAQNTQWACGGFAGSAPVAAGYDSPKNRNRLLLAMRMAEQKGCTPAQIALAYLRHQPFPVYPIVGTSNSDRLQEAWESLRVHLDHVEVEDLRDPE